MTALPHLAHTIAAWSVFAAAGGVAIYALAGVGVQIFHKFNGGN